MRKFRITVIQFLRGIVALCYVLATESSNEGELYKFELNNEKYLEIFSPSRKRLRRYLRQHPYKSKENNMGDEISNRLKNYHIRNKEQQELSIKSQILEETNNIYQKKIEGISINDSLLESFLGYTSSATVNEKNEVQKTDFLYNLNTFITEKDESISPAFESIFDVNTNPSINMDLESCNELVNGEVESPLITAVRPKENQEINKSIITNIEKKDLWPESVTYDSLVSIDIYTESLFNINEEKEEEEKEEEKEEEEEEKEEEEEEELVPSKNINYINFFDALSEIPPSTFIEDISLKFNSMET